ncbi:hypothetical protein GOP47_0001366 [Adiantum capillus-veneris]|uniref:S-protein homolog n=1 Tax=Adiantum capillus-veneris TaxID=13818 RepID=A0A9D4ZN00_ADICA|nr:hypothetical protein GOP47_0001366 [Adiantum capillus-veneris]
MRVAPALILLLIFFLLCKTSQSTHRSTASDVLQEEKKLLFREDLVASKHMNSRRLLQSPQAGPWDWKDAMIKALTENNFLGNIMINRVGQVWWDRKVPNDFIKEYDIHIDGVAFHVCTFKGPAFFQTMGWYGWENWAFQGQYKRVDTFRVTFD